MSDTIAISMNVLPTTPSAKLGFEVWVDDVKHWDSQHVDKDTLIQFDVSDDDGTHCLKLVLKNKLSSHTQINEAGEILLDARLKIQNLQFDGIALGHAFNTLSTYQHNFNGNGVEISDKFFSEMGCNGTVSLEFTTPIYLWLLENM